MKVWSIKEVSDHCGVICSRVTSYARRHKTTTVDFSDISKLARIFNMTIENLVEILEKIAKILTVENIDIIR
nr:XRE family transcriptional regulator [Nostoc sp. ChiSLP03a]